jgi:hypothetical protein
MQSTIPLEIYTFLLKNLYCDLYDSLFYPVVLSLEEDAFVDFAFAQTRVIASLKFN